MRRLGVSLFCVLLLCGANRSSGAEKPSLTEEAEALRTSGKIREAAALFKKATSKTEGDERTFAVYRMLELGMPPDEPRGQKTNKNLERVRDAIIKSKQDSEKAALYVLVAIYDPHEPGLEGNLASFAASTNERIRFAGLYADGFRKTALDRPGEALQSFREALKVFDAMRADGSKSGASVPKEVAFLPWTRPQILEQIQRLETCLRDLSDEKLHDSARRLFLSENYSEAAKLFEKLLASFPDSPFSESAQFHLAACKAVLYAPLPKKKFLQNEREAPLLDYLKNFPEGRFRADAWTLIGDTRLLHPEIKPHAALEAWEEAYAASLELSDPQRDKQAELLFKLGVFSHYLGQMDKAAEFYTSEIALRPVIEKDHNLPNHTAELLKLCRSNQEVLLFQKKLIRPDSVPARLLFLLSCCSTARKFTLGDRVLKKLDTMNPASKKDKDPLFRASVEYERGTIRQLDGRYDDALDIFLAAEKNFPKSPLAPYCAFQVASIQGRYQKFGTQAAAKTFERLLKSYPNSSLAPRTLNALAFAYFVLEDYKKSRDAFLALKNKYPTLCDPVAVDRWLRQIDENLNSKKKNMDKPTTRNEIP